MTQPRILFDRVWKKFHRGEIHDSLRDLIPAVARKLLGRGPSEAELDEGDFWETRNLEQLSKQIGEQSAMLAKSKLLGGDAR